jgi:hypothetical protein
MQIQSRNTLSIHAFAALSTPKPPCVFAVNTHAVDKAGRGQEALHTPDPARTSTLLWYIVMQLYRFYVLQTVLPEGDETSAPLAQEDFRSHESKSADRAVTGEVGG